MVVVKRTAHGAKDAAWNAHFSCFEAVSWKSKASVRDSLCQRQGVCVFVSMFVVIIAQHVAVALSGFASPAKRVVSTRSRSPITLRADRAKICCLLRWTVPPVTNSVTVQEVDDDVQACITPMIPQRASLHRLRVTCCPAISVFVCAYCIHGFRKRWANRTGNGPPHRF